MEKEVKIKEYIERIREELSYKDYFHAKELCVRASNADSGNLCVKYLRDFIEMHKKDNGRYEQLNILELCAYLYKCREYITAENWESLNTFSDCLANEIIERENMTLMERKDEFYFVREFRESIVHIDNYIGRLAEIVKQQQIEGEGINRLLEAVENLKERLKARLESAMRTAEEREVEKENEKKKQAHDRIIKRCIIAFWITFIPLVIIIGCCVGKI
jgi:hypothetical protein